MLNLSDNSPEAQQRLQSLIQLLYKHPFAFCGGMWVTLVFLGGIATLGLFNPGPVEPETSRPLPTASTVQQEVSPQPVRKSFPGFTAKQPLKPFTAKQPVKSPDLPLLPLSLLAVVALGCAGGSYLLTQMLKSSAQDSQSPRRLKPTDTIRKKRRNPSQKPSSISRTPQSAGASPSFQIVNNQLTKTEKQLTQITVLPPEQLHPLDGGKESLAEMMDLRKRHSLSSLMRNK